MVSLRKWVWYRYALPSTRYADAGTTHTVHNTYAKCIYAGIKSNNESPLQVPVPKFIRIFSTTLVFKEVL